MSTKSKISRRKVIASLVDMLEARTSSEKVAHLLAAYLVETRQTRSKELYLRDLEMAVAERFGTVTAYVSSARQLPAKTREQVKQFIKAASRAKEVELVEQTDPGLIGGIVIQTADAELDGSVRTKLRNLRSI